MPNDMT